MKTLELTVPKLATIAATRGIAGFGAGLLAAPLIGESQRKTLGWVLLTFGALSTIPIAISVFGASRNS